VASDPPGAVDLVRRVEASAGIALPLNALEAVPIAGPTFTGELVRSGPRNLPNALYLLGQRMVDTDKTEWSELLDREDEKPTLVFRVSPEERADHLLREALYRDHVLARPPVGADVLNIRGQHMEQWLPRMRNPRNALLALVGNIELDEGERLARAWFGSWKGRPDAPPATLPPVPPPAADTGGLDRPTMLVDRAGESQSILVVSCRLPPADPGKQAVYELLQSTVASYVNTMVRYRAGAAYAVSSGLAFRGAGAADLRISLDVETRRVPEAMKAIRALWNRLATDGFDPGAVSQSRWGLSSGYNLRYETAAELALSVVEAWSLGWPLESLARYPDQLRASTPADLKAAFTTCRDTSASLVLGDKRVLQPLLQ
jgi:predicted Zn-dependent peptidase